MNWLSRIFKNWLSRIFKKKKKEEIENNVVIPKKFNFDNYKYILSIKSICHFENMTKTSFFQFDDTKIIELLYSTFVVSNPEIQITYKAFLFLIENEKFAKWIYSKHKEYSNVIGQFNEDDSSEETPLQKTKSENVMSMSDYATSLVIDYGMDVNYVMYKMNIWEIIEFFEAAATKMKRDMEQKRFWTYLNIMPHINTKKCKTPMDLVPFAWEKGQKEKRLQEDMKNNAYAVKHTIGRSIFGDKDKKVNGE